MMELPRQCDRMANMAKQYCDLIEECFVAADKSNADWVVSLEKLLPRLHVAVTALSMPVDDGQRYCLYDDEQRCELFLRLNRALQGDQQIWSAYTGRMVAPRTRQQWCERMADNLTDMYFDLKRGLDIVEENPNHAAADWQYSFYVHWGKHLLDAECWLHAVECGGEPVLLPEWRWPNASGLIANPA